ncbi:hypothetical protein TB2_035605 [Malus domestica]
MQTTHIWIPKERDMEEKEAGEVRYRGMRRQAQIRNSKRHDMSVWLGTFNTAEEAVRTYGRAWISLL